jgi:tetratricopeptide (TPR) repeat protein
VIVSVTISDNRENVIADAIRSVVDHVDHVLLVDTGITDATVERTAEVAGEKFSVVRHTWVDFSVARNAALSVARALGATWIVIVDSDERIDLGALDLKYTLEQTRANVLRIEQDDGHYPKQKILRAAVDLYFVGPTHEALVGGDVCETLSGAIFRELPKTEKQLKQKYARDVLLLSDYVASRPDDPRWWHYLGVSYEGIGDYARAAAAFGECVERRKIGDEAAWAAYKQAEQLYTLRRFEESIAAAARGMNANAMSAECAWVAAVASWRLERPEQAVAWARIAEAVGLYNGCGVPRPHFRHMPAMYELPYDVLREALPDEEGRKQADADFYAAKRARIGVTDEDDLDRLSVSLSVVHRNEIRAMLRPPLLKKLCPSAELKEISFEPPGGRRPMNPSICWHEGTLWCVVRTVNYEIIEKTYTVDDADGIVRTENYLGRLVDGEFIEPRPMRDRDPSLRQPSRIVGYEDIRLVSVHGELTGSATVCDRDPSGRRLIARLHLNKVGDVMRADVQPSNQQHEKNWMPLAVDDKFTWIYSLDPTAILPGPLRSCPLALDHLRGGAAIPFDEGYLCVTHETIDTDKGRIYLHRFVYLDDEFNVEAVSPSWVFAHYGIEFCSGLALDGESILLTYGIDDKEAWLARIDVEEIKAMEWITP